MPVLTNIISLGLAVVAWTSILFTSTLEAQTPDPTPLHVPGPEVRPALSPFPRFEDWSFLRDPSTRSDRYDRLKFLPLNASGSHYITLALENRSEFQYYPNSDWGAGPQDRTGYLAQRFMPYVDFRLGNHARVWVGLTFDDVGDKRAGPRPGIDKDIADVEEAFVEFGGNLHASHPGADVVIGRQELVLGKGRLLDDNEGINVRNSYDGVRLGYENATGRIDVFALKPVLNKPGAWDDIPNHAQSLWGVYASNVLLRGGAMIDVYYLAFDNKSMTYNAQQGREIRHTGGVRLFNRLPSAPPKAGFDYNEEAAIQWGAFGERSIHSWGLGSDLGWTAGKGEWRARYGFHADALSGDSGGLHRLGTFNPLFARAAYFGPKFALIGPSNVLSVQPSLFLHPFRNVTTNAEWIWFWRESTSDAVYAFQNVQLRPGNLSSSRYVGSQPQLETRWAIDEHLTGALTVAGFFPGAFLKQTPPAKTITFVNAGITYRF